MYGPRRISSCGNPIPKTVGIVAKRRSANFGVYNVRLLSALDKLLRDKPRYMGELSTSINDALLAVDLNTVELVKLQSRQKQTGRETEVFDEPARKQRSSSLLLKDWRRRTQKTNQGTGGIHAIVRHNVGVGASRASSDALRTFSCAASFRRCRRARWDILRIRPQSESDGESH